MILQLISKVSQVLGGVADGAEGLALAEIVGERGSVLHIARDAGRMDVARQALGFFAPEVEVHTFPAWDCMPYDRVSPSATVLAERMETLSHLAATPSGPRVVVLTTMNAAVQRIPPRAALLEAGFTARTGEALDMDALTALCARDGYARVGTVREPGEVAVRGGIVDIYPPGAEQPLRLDLFGDVLESLRTFDPLDQRTTGEAETLVLLPANEVLLDTGSVARFRAGYSARFGTTGGSDPLYESVSAGRRHAGQEHWLPLFFDRLETVFDAVPDAVVTLDHGAAEAREARVAEIADNYAARTEVPRGAQALPYRPLPPDALYLAEPEWDAALAARPTVRLSPFDDGDRSLGAGPGRDFAAERTRAAPSESGGLVLDAVREHIRAGQAAGRRTVLAAFSPGSRERLAGLLLDHRAEHLVHARTWPEVESLPTDSVAMVVLGIEHGFETAALALLTEQDLLGERISRPARRSRRAEDFVREVSTLSAGDLVVHVDHGIGRFDGLETLTVHDQPHDCALLVYDGGDRLYLPVENLDAISRYGGNAEGATLDRLGGTAWQARKARARKRIQKMAGDLLRVAAQRVLRKAPKLAAAPGAYAEFCARFPYSETDDQDRTIAEVLADLGSGRPMDRLVCGDVGFGKTEVALRSAFVAVMSGKQVALLAPTTLLVRQHHRTFRERFRGWPIRIGALSRMTKPADAALVRKELAAGTLDIVIGTHALLAKGVSVHDLGLMIVDEEQRFGVAHKERLKELGAGVHILTLTATPIPRTLQMALAGVRELSLIATPPMDRLAIRSFILPFDAMVVREAIRRELERGGQVFYVCPHVSDLAEAADFVTRNIAEAKVAVAHGQLPTAELERAISEFYDGASNVLVSTNIIESGLDIPTANTLIIHRADMFGLADLYQLRGRIGRSKTRAYAYLTLPQSRVPTGAAEKRLRVMQSLEGLGAGFSVASHDMDIRGGGNFLGAEQSGHIREVGFELYQRMVEEAVLAARAAESGAAPAEAEEQWSPEINVGAAVLIPEAYVSDLDLRLGLYRRVADLRNASELEAFAAELIDRFGPLPEPAEHLLQVVGIKHALHAAGVERLDAGPKGATLAFHNDTFADPAGLARFLVTHAGTARLRPDHKLVLLAEWIHPSTRLTGIRSIAEQLAAIARAAGSEANSP